MKPPRSSSALPTSDTAFVRPKTVQQALLTELRQLIVAGTLAPGAPIRQDEVAERFGMSRIPVREALKTLEGEGYVTYQAHFGYAVTELTAAELLEIYHMREWLETGLLRLAVPKLTAEDAAVMREAMSAMVAATEAGDMTGVNAQNRVFHFRLFQPSGMARAIDATRRLWDATDPYRRLYFDEHYSADTINSEHEQILDAAVAGDVEETVRLLDVHRGSTMDLLRQHVAPEP
jgi:DNA-binding GntR family transcriptional regulator